jgi:hypothetical protein
MKDFFADYKKAHADLLADVEQLSGIRKRLMSTTRKSKDTGQLETVAAQMAKVGESLTEAKARHSARVDELDEKFVEKIRAICSYAVGVGRADSGVHYLLRECRDFASAKGDYERRRALFGSICEVAEAVGAAKEGKKASDDEDEKILCQFEAITDPEQHAVFYRENREAISRGYNKRQRRQS